MKRALFLLLIAAGAAAQPPSGTASQPLTGKAQPPSHKTQPLSELIERLFAQSPVTRTAFWGIQVTELSTGKTLYQLNANRFFVPASNTKLFSTSLALTRLGPDFTFQTRVLAGVAPDADGRIAGGRPPGGRRRPQSFRARHSLPHRANGRRPAGRHRQPGRSSGRPRHPPHRWRHCGRRLLVCLGTLRQRLVHRRPHLRLRRARFRPHRQRQCFHPEHPSRRAGWRPGRARAQPRRGILQHRQPDPHSGREWRSTC
jgi:hypothetical protein